MCVSRQYIYRRQLWTCTSRCFDVRVVLLAELSLQTSAELQILTVACWLDFWEVDVGKSCAGAKAKEED
jgi:hypothetical protein